MQSRVEATWWLRLLAGLGSLIFTLLIATLLLVIRDYRREPNLQWSNGGESQLVAAMLLIGIVVLATYVVLVVPLLLLWPVRSQRRHWYAVLGVAMLLPPLLLGMIIRHERLLITLRDMQRYPGLYGWLELFALCSCGIYLLLIQWQHRRLVRGTANGADR